MKNVLFYAQMIDLPSLLVVMPASLALHHFSRPTANDGESSFLSHKPHAQPTDTLAARSGSISLIIVFFLLLLLRPKNDTL